MDSYSEENEDEDCFYDAHEVFDELSDSDSNEDCCTSGFGYDYWVCNLDGADTRRDKFLKFMGLNSSWLVHRDHIETEYDYEHEHEHEHVFVDEIRQDKEVVLPVKTDSKEAVPSISNWSSRVMKFESSVQDHVEVKTRVLDEEIDCKAIKADVSSSRKQGEIRNLLDRRKKVKKGWLQKLSVMARITDKHDDGSLTCNKESNNTKSKDSCSVNVHSHKKKSKELSSLYATQEFAAHNGSITMIKFSHDGRYLASAGEDGIVRVWMIFEDHDPNLSKTRQTDHSSVYFSTNPLSELARVKVNNEKTRGIKGFGKSSELACVILPPKVFRILERPVHEFHGHFGEILSLSWSKKGYLLSSSVDKTVRMWKVGHCKCLKVFTHNNYVTCVEFNPVDDNYFISGSIDGKVRIWDVHSCHVIDWIDVGDIVTAVSYNPNGKGSIVGTLDGKCSFYEIIDERLQLCTQISSMSKKKWPKRITGFQFCPIDSRKIMVSSADSQVRILCGINVVGKFKGNRSSGSQMSACFTSDGKHIISVADDSNIYVWNNIKSPHKFVKKPKTNLSFENFLSQNATIAIPWCGIKTIAATLPSPRLTLTNNNTSTNVVVPRSTIDSPRVQSPSSTTTLGFFLRAPPTWPAETLPDSTQVSVSPSMHRSEYRFLKSAYQNTFVAPHMWGLVIVAAGWDGRIRTYLNYGLPIRM
ncbi:uncharacterized protein [Rutidosis leptorrhynchoides]|uniref:uncharacterized protein n=1 Tax=Rutidosis leptorrhynchoides TaxID=125765 RepID=UPI003A992724